MRGPLAMNQDPRKPPSWRIYEYVIASNTLHAVINPASDSDPLTVNDVSPTTCGRAHRVLLHAPDTVEGHPDQ